jgi:hypothetical protein
MNMENIKRGDCFDIKGYGWHILSQVNPGKIALVGLQKNSNRYNDPILVEDLNNITDTEFRLCLNDEKYEEIIKTKTSIEDLLKGITGLKLPESIWKIE